MPRLAALSIAASAAFAAIAPMPGHAQPAVEAAPVAIDFSYAGYGAGAGLPLVRGVALLVRPSGGDDTALLRAAIAEAARLPRRADGMRGVVQLAPGRFRIAGQLRLDADGIVLRGSPDGRSVLVASGRGRRALIVAGRGRAAATAPAVQVTDEIVPPGRVRSPWRAPPA
jgi:hypothetical protein